MQNTRHLRSYASDINRPRSRSQPSDGSGDNSRAVGGGGNAGLVTRLLHLPRRQVRRHRPRRPLRPLRVPPVLEVHRDAGFLGQRDLLLPPPLQPLVPPRRVELVEPSSFEHGGRGCRIRDAVTAPGSQDQLRQQVRRDADRGLGPGMRFLRVLRWRSRWRKNRINAPC